MSMVSKCLTVLCLLFLGSIAGAQDFGVMQVNGPEGLRVILDGKFVGLCKDGSLLIRNIPYGAHTVQIEKQGYHPRGPDTFLLNEDQVFVYEAEALHPVEDDAEGMVQVGGDGHLLIQTLPLECIVLIPDIGIIRDDPRSEKTEDQWYIESAPAGRYLASLAARGKEFREMVTIRPGETTHLFVDIDQESVLDVGAVRKHKEQRARALDASQALAYAQRSLEREASRQSEESRKAREQAKAKMLLELLHAGSQEYDKGRYAECQYAMLGALYIAPDNEVAGLFYRDATAKRAEIERRRQLAGVYEQVRLRKKDGIGFELSDNQGVWQVSYFCEPGAEPEEALDVAVDGQTLKFTRRLQLSLREGKALRKRARIAYEDYELESDGDRFSGRRRWRYRKKKFRGVKTDTWEAVVFLNKSAQAPPRGNLGAFLSDVPQVAALEGDGDMRGFLERKGWAGQQGAVVLCCFPDSAAGKAGLRPGDLILGLDGFAVADSAALYEKIAAHSTQPVSLAVFREGRELTLAVMLEMR